jgi:Plasmid encoded RepA protein
MKKAGEILLESDALTRRNITGISKQLRKRIEGVELVRAAREEGRQEIGFNSRPFVLCGLPIRRPGKEVREYSRVNGRFSLRIATNNSRLGLPFGQDRLIPLWVSTLAVRQQNRRVTFDSAAELLREFGLSTSGYHYKRIVQGFERVFDATIYFSADGTAATGGARYIDRSRFNFFDSMRLWYLDDNPGLPGEDFQNIIVLSESFWNEVKQHPIPVDMALVRALAHAPGALDFACWLIWRCWTAKQEQLIPLFGESGLEMQLGVQDYARKRRFREQVVKWLDVVKAHWPECPAEMTAQFLIIRPGQAIRALPSWKRAKP